MKLLSLPFLLLIALWVYLPTIAFAQLTAEQEATVKRTTERYTTLLQRLGRNHNDTDAFKELATQIFTSGARVYDDFLEGEVLDEYMVYLGKVRDFKGQLRLGFSNYSYRYKRQYGLDLGVVQLNKTVQSARMNYTTTNYLIINANTGQLTEITQNLPPNTYIFGEKEIIKAPVTITFTTVTNRQNGDIIKDLPWLEMVYVEGGTFKMGSEEGDSDEKPIHEVSVNNYYIGMYEVTVAQFKRFIDATSYQTDAEKDGDSYIWNGSEWEKKAGINWEYDTQGNRRPESEYQHPVIHVSWNDCKAFCNWLSKETGEDYRLPTEAEWEYVARGGNKSKGYNYSGSNSLDELAWYNGNSGSKTHSVGDKESNELGIYDISGNVWEWCSDWYGADYYGKSPKENPQGPENGEYRVVRGGSWGNSDNSCRVAGRNSVNPNSRVNDLGFRLVRDS